MRAMAFQAKQERSQGAAVAAVFKSRLATQSTGVTLNLRPFICGRRRSFSTSDLSPKQPHCKASSTLQVAHLPGSGRTRPRQLRPSQNGHLRIGLTMLRRAHGRWQGGKGPIRPGR